MSDQERESRKRKLKERVIPGELEKKEREEQPEKAGERIALPRHFLLPLLFLLLLTLGLLFFFYNRRRYSRLTSKWSVDFSEKGESSGEYYSFSEGIVKVSRMAPLIFPLPERCFGIRPTKWLHRLFPSMGTIW